MAMAALMLAACGDSGAPQGQSAVQDMPETPEALCTSESGALSYVDKRDDRLMADVKANKPVGKVFNDFLAYIKAESDKAKAGGDWVAYCKGVDAWLTANKY